MRDAMVAALAATLVFSSIAACSKEESAAADPADDGGAGDGSSSSSVEGGGPLDPDAEPTGPPAVRWLGRFDTSDPNGPRIAWSGARAIVRFTGSTLSVRVTEKNIDRGPSGYDVIIDGKVQGAPFYPADGKGEYIIAKDLGAGVHVVELWRRTGPIVGLTQFHGFDIGGGGGGELLPPPNPALRRIEFLADSAATGYGVECANASGSNSGATQNERKSYPALIAKALGAEHFNLSYEGKGVLRNYEDGDPVMYASIFMRTLPDDASSKWTFGSSWVPDVVFIGLGGNDFEHPEVRDAPDLGAFKAKYHELVTLVRGKYPKAQIICSVAASLNDTYPPGWNAFTSLSSTLKELVDERHGAPFSDANVHYFELPRAKSSGPGPEGSPDLSACEYHSNAAFHQKIADQAVAKIKTITSW